MVRQSPTQQSFDHGSNDFEERGAPRYLSSNSLYAEHTPAADPRRECRQFCYDSFDDGPLLMVSTEAGSSQCAFSSESCFSLGAAFSSPAGSSDLSPSPPPLSGNQGDLTAPETRHLVDIGKWINQLGGRENFCYQLASWCLDSVGAIWKDSTFDDVIATLLQHPVIGSQMNACISCEADLNRT